MDAARTEPEARDITRDLRDTLESRELREVGEARIDGLIAEASAAVSYSANTLRSVTERYRAAYNDELSRWQALSDELETLESRATERRPISRRPRRTGRARPQPRRLRPPRRPRSARRTVASAASGPT